MSTRDVDVPVIRSSAGRPRPPAPLPFLRLVRVELRKQVDTRAGLSLVVSIVAVNAALLTLVLVTALPHELTWQRLTMSASVGQAVLLPLVGVLAATGEWSQRTALTTFVLEPRRTRVQLAKLVSAAGLAVLVMALTVALGAALNAVGAVALDGDGAWDLDWVAVAGSTAGLVLLVTQGVAFGLLLLSTPAALVAYLALPTAWSVVTLLVPALHRPGEWLDLNRTLGPLLDGDLTAAGAARLGTSAALWIALPLALGLRRTARRDVA